MTEPLATGPREGRPPVYGEQVTAELLNFNIIKTVEVDPDLEAIARAAIAAVWAAEMGTPASVTVAFTERLILSMHGREAAVGSHYVDSTDTISIALQTLRDQHPGEELGLYVLLHAAHEARHKVHFAIGDEPPPSAHSMSDGSYVDSRHEDEAWQSATQAYSALYAGRWITFTVGSRLYSNR